MRGQVFYFIAQTGSISPRRLSVPSNFYTYVIPEIRKGEVLAEVEVARLGSGGLEYPAQFLRDLIAWDKQGQKLEVS